MNDGKGDGGTPYERAVMCCMAVMLYCRIMRRRCNGRADCDTEDPSLAFGRYLFSEDD